MRRHTEEKEEKVKEEEKGEEEEKEEGGKEGEESKRSRRGQGRERSRRLWPSKVHAPTNAAHQADGLTRPRRLRTCWT
jgi:hypothetical protein